MPLRLRRNGARAVVVMTALVMGLLFVMPFTGTARATDSNQVDFWCDKGIKIEPIGTPSYTVPPPPDGFTWTLLVVKSATDNETFPNPIPGQSYTPGNGHDVSHVILCMESIPTTTTTTTTTITTPTSTTSTTTTTSPTTDPPPTTTPTAPTITTTTSPITDPPPTTTTSTHVDPPPITVTIPSGDTTTTEPPPVGGVSAGGGSTAVGGSGAAVLWLAGGALALLTGATLVAQRRGARGR